MLGRGAGRHGLFAGTAQPWAALVAYVCSTVACVRQVSASGLRRNIHRLLDEVLESGEPLEIPRRGRVLRVVAEATASKTAAMRGNPHALTGDPDDVVPVDWSPSWARQG